MLAKTTTLVNVVFCSIFVFFFFFWFASYFVAEVRPPICYLLSYLEERETDLSGIWCTDYSWLG